MGIHGKARHLDSGKNLRVSSPPPREVLLLQMCALVLLTSFSELTSSVVCASENIGTINGRNSNLLLGNLIRKSIINNK